MNMFKEARANPKKALEGLPALARPTGKSMMAATWMGIVMDMYVKHPKRMRGLYVHRRKNRTLRQHRMKA